MAATIHDVAQRCGVDPAVVQRVLDARMADISEETRRKVIESADALGYSAPPRAGNIGVLYADESGRGLTHPFFSLVLNALRTEAEARGYDITFIRESTDGEPGDYLERCRRRNVDGICMVCVDFADPGIKALAASGFPCLSVDHIFKRVPAVLSDNETGARKLVEYAIDKGHRRIAFIHGQNNSVVTRTRISLFKNTMAYYNLPLPPDYVREGRYHDIALTKNIVGELLRLPERPTCILLPDDLTYLGAQEATRELGLRIPEDISFAGYDGIPLTQTLTPRLTTIRQSCDNLGKEAAQRLIDLIENPETASRKPFVFPVELVEGATIASV